MKNKDRIDVIEWKLDCFKQKRGNYVQYQTFTWEDMAFVLDSYTRAINTLAEIANTEVSTSCVLNEEAFYEVREEAANTLLELGEVNDPQAGERT